MSDEQKERLRILAAGWKRAAKRNKAAANSWKDGYSVQTEFYGGRVESLLSEIGRLKVELAQAKDGGISGVVLHISDDIACSIGDRAMTPYHGGGEVYNRLEAESIFGVDQLNVIAR